MTFLIKRTCEFLCDICQIQATTLAEEIKMNRLFYYFGNNVGAVWSLVKMDMEDRFLAHLSRRLMGELIVYQSLRRPSVNIFKHLLL